ncbi:putative glucan endo-1,3-beta-D-glucosidase [Helianthus annuus]|nr:putative glucan endo-1,3-beta-D-glucosidase [Helianthus annuus]
MATLLYSISLVLLPLFSLADGGSIGVNYGRIGGDLPSAFKVTNLLKSQGINRVRVYDTDPAVLKSLSGTGIKVTVNLPNELLYAASRKQSFAYGWIRRNVVAYYPHTQIEAIAVGNEVFVDPKNTTGFLIPAIKNIHQALVKYKLDSVIKLSSPVALSALQNSYPSSSGSFRPELIEPVFKPMFEFLRETGSFLMVNAYPFFAYESNSDVISIDYSLFKENPGVVDPNNGLRYFNLFDAQIDAVFAAMTALKYDDIPLVVVENAAAYNGNLIKRVLTGGGTPLRPKANLTVFLFALFNENKKPGPESERNYGLFYPNMEKVYNIPFTVEGLKDFSGEISPDVGKDKLQSGLDYACGEGGADCREIQPGATCYDPDTLEAHASFAFNSFYQKMGRAAGACDFDGAAYVVTELPRFGSVNSPPDTREKGWHFCDDYVTIFIYNSFVIILMEAYIKHY